MPTATLKYRAVTDIPLSELKARGIVLLLLDLDNTLAPYYVGEPSTEVRAWAEELRQGGVELMVYSNNKSERPRRFAELLGGIDYRCHARKPHPEGVREIMAAKGLRKDQIAVVGDQIFTDILCAERAGVAGILLEPILLWRPFHILRYLIELPFRIKEREV